MHKTFISNKTLKKEFQNKINLKNNRMIARSRDDPYKGLSKEDNFKTTEELEAFLIFKKLRY